MRTQRQRWNAAWKAVANLGAYTQLNRMDCCRTCAACDMEGNYKPGTPVVWTYGGQGNYLAFARDTGMARNDYQYIYHENGGAHLIVTALRNEGFDVEWDGDDTRAVLCRFV